MLRIPCPSCGERDYTEFRYGGDANKGGPRMATATSRHGTTTYFCSTIPKVAHLEYWQHVLGCRQWLVLERDTATNAVGRSVLAREAHEQ